MRTLVLVVVLAGCKEVFDMEGYVPPENAPPRPEQPWSERVVGATRAGTIVAVTRDGFGFPDAMTDYRLYLGARRFAEGSLETWDWERAISHDESTNTFTFSLVTDRCIVDDQGAHCVRIKPAW